MSADGKSVSDYRLHVVICRRVSDIRGVIETCAHCGHCFISGDVGYSRTLSIEGETASFATCTNCQSALIVDGGLDRQFKLNVAKAARLLFTAHQGRA
jgi:hypothetical protein